MSSMLEKHAKLKSFRHVLIKFSNNVASLSSGCRHQDQLFVADTPTTRRLQWLHEVDDNESCYSKSSSCNWDGSKVYLSTLKHSEKLAKWGKIPFSMAVCLYEKRRKMLSHKLKYHPHRVCAERSSSVSQSSRTTFTSWAAHHIQKWKSRSFLRWFMILIRHSTARFHISRIHVHEAAGELRHITFYRLPPHIFPSPLWAVCFTLHNSVMITKEVEIMEILASFSHSRRMRDGIYLLKLWLFVSLSTQLFIFFAQICALDGKEGLYDASFYKHIVRRVQTNESELSTETRLHHSHKVFRVMRKDKRQIFFFETTNIFCRYEKNSLRVKLVFRS